MAFPRKNANPEIFVPFRHCQTGKRDYLKFRKNSTGPRPGTYLKGNEMVPEKDFSDLDANYKPQCVNGRDMIFHDGFAAPFVLEGVPFVDAEGRHRRLPQEAAEKCLRPPVIPMSLQGAGEVLRFVTDSTAIALDVTFDELFARPQRRASTGFDLYIGSGTEKRFCGNQFPATQDPHAELLFSALPLPRTREFREYTLYFPLHSAVRSIRIGVDPGCRIEPPAPHRVKKPLLFYGSSITNCGAVSRPGMNYPAIITRLLDLPMVNMGFSGACLGELHIADEIAGVDPVAMVLEYDHNAPDPEFLARTHEPFFRHLRALCPTLPVLLTSRCDFMNTPDGKRRREIVMRTFLHALDEGDRFVDFLDGETLFSGPFRYDCTIDNCHPNDLGATLMAERIADRIKRMLAPLDDTK